MKKSITTSSKYFITQVIFFVVQKTSSKTLQTRRPSGSGSHQKLLQVPSCWLNCLKKTPKILAMALPLVHEGAHRSIDTREIRESNMPGVVALFSFQEVLGQRYVKVFLRKSEHIQDIFRTYLFRTPMMFEFSVCLKVSGVRHLGPPTWSQAPNISRCQSLSWASGQSPGTSVSKKFCSHGCFTIIIHHRIMETFFLLETKYKSDTIHKFHANKISIVTIHIDVCGQVDPFVEIPQRIDHHTWTNGIAHKLRWPVGMGRGGVFETTK